MIVNNSGRIRWIKRFFYLGAVLMIVAILILVWLNRDLAAILTGFGVVAWFLIFQFADFEYIEFGLEEGQLFLRYYQVVKFGRKDYNRIEFPANLLKSYVLEKSLAGLVRDLVIVVKTKRGAAEYPPVSLAALSKAEVAKIEETLRLCLPR